MKWNLPPKYLHLSIILCGSYVGVAYTYKYACYLHSINSVFKLCMFAFVMFVCNVVSAYDIVCVCVRVTWCVCVCVTCVCVCACDVVCVSVCDMVCVCVTVWHGVCVVCVWHGVCVCVCVWQDVCVRCGTLPHLFVACSADVTSCKQGKDITAQARHLKSHPITWFQWWQTIPLPSPLAPIGLQQGTSNHILLNGFSDSPTILP